MSLADSSVGGATSSLFPEAKHASLSNEWYTPSAIVDAARALMGGIDLDPASSALANETIRATNIYTEASNGFAAPWHGRVFLNPPGGYCDRDGFRVVRASKGSAACTVTGSCGRDPGHAHEGVKSAAKSWWQKLANEYALGRVDQAVFIGFNSEILRSTQGCPGPICLDFPVCFAAQRLRFMTQRSGRLVPGDSPPHDSVVVWLPPRSPARETEDLAQFTAFFGKIGRCK